jgi:hypothetical protein
LIGWKDFHKLPLDNENKFREGSWEVFGFLIVLFCFFGRGERLRKRRKINLLCEKMFME